MKLRVRASPVCTRGTWGSNAHLIDDDGRNLNEEMIRGGWGTYYTKYGEGRFPEEFETAEEDAQDEGSGVWAD